VIGDADVMLAAFLAAIAAGAAALAVWSYLRWPALAPSTFGGAIVHGLLALGALQLVGLGLGVVADRSGEAVGLALLVLVLPALTYAFLAALWVLRLFAALIKGFG
jgi:hypothetical protein